MQSPIDITIFLDQYKRSKLLLIDTRSEGEYEHGHIPGAVNIPLLNNEHRAIVGTVYKQEGRQQAVIKGFELVGSMFHEKILKVKELTEASEVMLYCWRGGMRSGIFSWILNQAGYKATVLKGGYKSFRHWALDQFQVERNIIILGGRTGSGKTEMLQLIRKAGEQMICLETMAHHKGSAFGALGQPPQPRQEHFENKLAMELSDTDKTKILWLENESRNVGVVKIPDPLFDSMRAAPVVEMMVDHQMRISRILHEYGGFPKDVLAENTAKLGKRMGGQHVREAICFLYDDNKARWVEKLLDYYDKTYGFGNSLRVGKIISVDIDWKQAEDGMKLLIKEGYQL